MGKIAISEDMLGELSALAEADELPVEVETERLLRFAIDQRRERIKIAARLREVAAMTPKGVTQTDSVELLREDRDR